MLTKGALLGEVWRDGCPVLNAKSIIMVQAEARGYRGACAVNSDWCMAGPLAWHVHRKK